MATLADELLADLMSDEDDVGDVEDDAQINEAATEDPMEQDDAKDAEDAVDDEDSPDRSGAIKAAAAGKGAFADAEDAEEAKQRVEKINFASIGDVSSVAGLMKSLNPVLKEVDKYLSLPSDTQLQNIGTMEDNPEYNLLVQANSFASAIDNEIILVHKFIRDHYSIRFPELETMIQNPLQYAKAVAIIGNGPFDNVNMSSLVSSTKNLVGQSLNSVLDGPSLMVIRIEAVKTAGREMNVTELAIVMKACEMTLQLEKAKSILAAYVQSRMNVFAPNLTALIGSETAAQLVNTAGGLTALAKIPACNVPAMGSKKQTFGMATNTRVRRQGFLYHSTIVQDVPMDLRNQAMRIVSGKLVLAARCDRVHSTPDGSTGEKLRQDCLDRLDKLAIPPPNANSRALPAPDDKPSKKRGGRRARKLKEATAMTELQKAQNRMVFGKEEAEVGFGDETEGLGMIGSAASDGKVRSTQVDQRTRAKLSKKNPGWGFESNNSSGLASSIRGFGQAGNATVLKGAGLRASGVGAGSGTGTSSVIAFTPFQGLELVNPKAKEDLERKRKADEDKWFKSGTFTQLGPGSTPTPKVPKVDDAGFKVPAIPAIKRVKQNK